MVARPELSSAFQKTFVYKMLVSQFGFSERSSKPARYKALDWLFVVAFARALFPPESGDVFPQHTRLIGRAGNGKSTLVRYVKTCLNCLHLAQYNRGYDVDGFGTGVVNTFTYGSSPPGDKNVRHIIESNNISNEALSIPAVSIAFPRLLSLQPEDFKSKEDDVLVLYRWGVLLYLEWRDDPDRFVVPDLLCGYVSVSRPRPMLE
jgi:hypothetical protein